MSFEWSDVSEIVGKAAPLVGGLLGGPAGAAVGGLVASALGVENKPDAVSQAVRNDPDAALKLQAMQNQHKERLEQLALDAESARMAEQTKRMLSVNKTMQAEMSSDDRFKSGWRPAIGWILAAAFGGIALALVFVMFKDPTQAGEVMGAVMWLVGAMGGVLGVNIHSRSVDKQVALGAQPKGILGALRGPN